MQISRRKSWLFVLGAAVLGSCAAPEVETPVVSAVASTPVPAVAATPLPSSTQSLSTLSKSAPGPTAKLAPKPTPFKAKPAKGLSETQRRKIFYDLRDAEDRAREEADKKFSPYETATINANLDENERLTEKFKAEIIADYKLIQAQVETITNEGVDNQWPPLTPLKSPY